MSAQQTLTLAKSRAQLRVECPAALAARTPVARIVQFPPFAQWLEALDTQLAAGSEAGVAVRAVTIQSVDEFRAGSIGFLKFATDAVHTADGAAVPGVVFLRGGAVAMLVILRTRARDRPVPSWEDTDLVVLVEQPRLAVPDLALAELPAGMLDGATGGFAGAAARELREETGLAIGGDELVDITPPSAGRGLLPSPGACDEFIRFYACEKVVSEAELDKLQGRLAGLRAEGERITLRLVRLCDLWTSTRDLQALAAVHLWDQHNRRQ
ncbi:hypothetical protein IWQ57_004243 [Coemansia nantahalensis]|uniref:Uncharacterized protein n=1 Tax=Coemansia nantahalensis TaxID=2789366 RepID=A0ACC1JT28_9FUNG|nr:hypothetical protein IWQ57_004243 [Coemansia nantahalensis]